MWIGRLLDGTVTYFAMSIEIDLVWWELACDEQSCLMKSPFTLLWEDHLWDCYGAFGVRLVHDSRELTWLYQIDIDIQYWSFEGLIAGCLRPWSQNGWPSFRLAHTLLPLLTSRPLLALWASHEHHSLLFLIALFTFYIGIGALQCMHALFRSFTSLGPRGAFSSLYSLYVCITAFSSHLISCVIRLILFTLFTAHLHHFLPPWVVILLSSLHRG